ncbi:hypothetical protein NG54_03305 [Heyndrickxia ginsengihumi]|uniref:Uncharacterized protein n=1 Tax=Heyndrickxia ginsengihumi TaxID=363870 RepID=A0A0A6Y276_9BACI|nr:hypothetical protein [Heyndrickxia ginsengihumi]KHD86357.1 hypothetical protein NG54_03305 [Heyndrickxia ginsengihumi]
MSISDKIQLASIAASTFISIISIIIAVSSLKLTKRSIEDANRPYVSCYASNIDTGFSHKYFVIKNFGKSAAIIKGLEFDKPLDKFNQVKQLKSVINSSIMPNQKFISVVDDNYKEIINVTIHYTDLNGKNYKEVFSINFAYAADLLWTQTNRNNKSDEYNAILNATHSIIKFFS